eukprot:880603-Pelagomonas_calceolata.AAC.2
MALTDARRGSTSLIFCHQVNACKQERKHGRQQVVLFGPAFLSWHCAALSTDSAKNKHRGGVWCAEHVINVKAVCTAHGGRAHDIAASRCPWLA